MKTRWQFVLVISGVLLSCRCMMAAATYSDVLIADVPHVQQKPDFCGEAAAEMYLRKLKHAITQDQVFNASGLDPSLGRGCYTIELNRALQKLGFKTGTVWSRLNNMRLAAELEVQWKELHGDLLKGIASIVCMHYDAEPDTTEHFRLVVGYSSRTDEVIYHEPAIADGAYQRMKRKQWLKLWPLSLDRSHSTAIRLRLEPIKVQEPPAASGFTNADYAQHVMALRAKLPAGFHIVVQPPFVIIGDEAPAVVRRHSVNTVKWAVDKLKADYFSKDPKDILDIWLFKDRESYEKNNKVLFNETPSTPYGYYSATNKALVMNIQTGGGTLVHEIVHPFMATNFPDCPPWFNEGMGSLYEQCGEEDGHIHGYTNWRLPGLQQALKARTVPSFQTLMEMDIDEFYTDERGTNYGQARYLCYYLQEQGLLIRFYREFVKNSKDDPSGYKTLQAVLGTNDMAAFEKKWGAFVLKQVF